MGMKREVLKSYKDEIGVEILILKAGNYYEVCFCAGGRVLSARGCKTFEYAEERAERYIKETRSTPPPGRCKNTQDKINARALEVIISKCKERGDKTIESWILGNER